MLANIGNNEALVNPPLVIANPFDKFGCKFNRNFNFFIYRNCDATITSLGLLFPLANVGVILFCVKPRAIFSYKKGFGLCSPSLVAPLSQVPTFELRFLQQKIMTLFFYQLALPLGNHVIFLHQH